jgi:hypothetical protein
MRRLDEDTALSILFANTKKTKRPADLLTVAESCHYLVNLYGASRIVAEKAGLSAEMIREFCSLLKLPGEVKNLIRDRRIDKLDVAYRLSTLGGPAEQVAAAGALWSVPSSKDVRDIIRLVKRTHLPIEDAKRMVLEAKPKALHLFVVDFDDAAYVAITEHAKRLGLDPAELVRDIVADWLSRQDRLRED